MGTGFFHQEAKMKCALCIKGQTKPGLATITFKIGEKIIVVKDAPAEICDTCGESYFSEEITDRLLRLAEGEKDVKEEVKVIRYAA
jgi:YgiT-type zinc finger domain-containing protein